MRLTDRFVAVDSQAAVGVSTRLTKRGNRGIAFFVPSRGRLPKLNCRVVFPTGSDRNCNRSIGRAAGPILSTMIARSRRDRARPFRDAAGEVREKRHGNTNRFPEWLPSSRYLPPRVCCSAVSSSTSEAAAQHPAPDTIASPFSAALLLSAGSSLM